MDVLRFSGRDGTALAYRDIGSGRPLVLLHGFMGTGQQWLDRGPAPVLVQQGLRLLLPDFRGHGLSERSHDPLAYPPDVLADDGLAFIEHLGLGAGEYDLGGYSLGGRIVVRMLARGAEPGRAIVAGQGLAKVSGEQGRDASQRDLISSWAERLGADPQALLHVLASLVATPEAELRTIMIPTRVVIGDQDERADADQLAALLPAGSFARVPGGHGDALTTPEFATALSSYLVRD